MIEPRVRVIDDDAAMRESLSILLKSANLASDAFVSAEDFLGKCKPQWRGCLVLDMRMPGMSGQDLLEQLAGRSIFLPTIIITAHGDVPMAVNAMKTGVFDFIEKPFRAAVLLDRIRDALDLDERLSEARRQRQLVVDRLGLLTKRERHVFDLVIQGKSMKEIADALKLSPKTVQIYRTNVLSKMDAHSPAQLVLLTEALRPPPSGRPQSGL